MTAPDYKDVTSGLMGGVAGKFSPDFYNQSWTTQKNLGQRAFDRAKLPQDWTRSQEMQNLDADRAWRALPASYNQRGMLDSGQDQRGGQRLADAYGRATGDLRSDLETVLQGLGLQDLTAQYDLGELRQMVGTDRFQQVVANALRSQGMA